VALTAGDADYDVGTDVAVLFEARDPKTLEARLVRQVVLNTVGETEVKSETREIAGVTYQSWRNEDRTVSAYIARIGDAVVVANSPVQLRNVVETYQKKLPALAELDEYRFFRGRYVPGAAGETAFAIQTGATSRRINGPRWIIAQSRRIRDLAVLSHLQAEHLNALATGTAEPKTLRPELPLSTAGDVEVAAAGLRSASVGSVRFMTPVGEMTLDRVTRSEADAYARWREKHKEGSNESLGSIACRFCADDAGLAVDASIKALIDLGEGKEYVDVFKGVTLGPGSGDPHGAVFHAAAAFNPRAEPLKRLLAATRGFAPQLPLDPPDWIGPSIAVYADDSPLWEELAKLGSDDERQAFVTRNAYRLPVAVNIGVANAFQATASLAALRGLVEQAAPGATTWEALKHGEQSYVKIGLKINPGLPAEIFEKAGLYYALTAESLTVSLNEDLIKRALDRLAERETKAANEPNRANAGTSAWLGDTFRLELNGVPLRELIALADREHRKETGRLSWGNLSVLNEWKRMFPEEDPVAVHERLWGVRLVCPGGGRYVWNEQVRMMESTVYGRPTAPKEAEHSLPQLREFSGIRLGASIEDQGFRVRVELKRGK
jgi:hypothetical protein